ncbi:hypothetical protein D6853_11450 [Butyrivibrio sp. X503]|uniref:hypothetical protein n=1 Tax=Butyrivibrio sp. X503 TaxID=2364878 RepID=UPI000EA97F07|nr:hypothetical protein [Butyrivibrio sp. X503]RKM55325.1 hypothetical protein D6853_11450 [Butyrivibrio sp. X503]
MELKKITIVALLLLIAVISITKVAPWAGDPGTHKHTIEQTDNKIESVMILSGGSAATSATLSLLPGDMCTPIADQLAELSKYFLVILCALYLEKFMISLSGYIVFGVLIPIACVLLCAWVISGKRKWAQTAGKIALIGLIIFLIVPASVKLSDLVYQTQADRVETAVEEYNDLEIEGGSEDGSEGGFFNELTTITSDTVDRITSFVKSLLESLAVMIVTACVIPVFVLAVLIWFVKTIFSSNVLSLDPDTIDALVDKLGIKKE